MERTVIVGIVFALIAVGWILGTGQWAYGNVVGPLVNYSKLPKVEVPYVSAAPTTDGTILTLNLTDVDGPDAYPASVVMIEIGNSTWHIFLNSSQLANYTVEVHQAPWNENKKDSVNWYSGFEIPLGSEGQFVLHLPFRLSPGSYELTLYTPAVKPVTVKFTSS
ncbi:quinol oxidase [Sulfodiicoccus acidiphilus]|uniref:Quinol oxidase n=1 Tax=Sulfodiicoccus acidiphilus TaxID=1670455 RepID=A0A348B255_9CREN|nr:TQO small subunit DoxA domain-containing protein [Sulfodiicoccus acidiphilus]BBD72257.1 quinol oxidase [Sulfodiicoccus acidiphilus]GGT90735.1 quinol oxidase [Sulfodiicoccus acidiphilus]